tara:strand:- start:6388 stop:6984 length:597 start_codon:yes stop_codon:yes gene_type:complete
LKRIFDLTLLLISFPLVLLIVTIFSFIIFIFQGRPVFFKQDRLGKNHLRFKIIKFSSMTRDRGMDGELLPDKDRITKLGDFIRKTSVDELPSLWNVLLGQMSFVGPRPLRERYLKRYSAEQDRRHEVKPGVTGWAQINGRNAVTWDKRFELDVWYVDNQSFFLDLKILFSTIFVVLLRKDINSSDDFTMEEFEGNHSN